MLTFVLFVLFVAICSLRFFVPSSDTGRKEEVYESDQGLPD